MFPYTSPERHIVILSAILDEGMSLMDAAKTFLVPEKDITKWLRKASPSDRTPTSEVERLRQQGHELRAIIAKLRRG